MKNCFHFFFFVRCFIFAMLMGSAHPILTAPPLPDQTESRTGPVTIQFFGLHRVMEDPWPTVPFGSWRITVAWKSVEPSKGVWDFKVPDQEVDQATQHGVDLVIDIGFVPQWASSAPTKSCRVGMGECAEPANLQDWSEWIRTIGTRYKGKVKYYEMWNEPNDSSTFYTGSIPGLVRMTKAARDVLKSIDPSIQVLTPAPTGPAGATFMDSFLASGGADFADIVSYHFYVNGPPEGLFRYVKQIRSSMEKHGIGNKPLWDSENGWTGAPLDDSTQAAYVARTTLLERSAGIERMFWYGWGFRQTQTLHFVEDDRHTPSSGGQALKTIEDWTIGAVVESCESSDEPQPGETSHSLWICRIDRNGLSDFVVWNPAGNVEFGVPDKWGVRINETRDLSGDARRLSANRKTTVGSKPILFTHAE